MCAALVVPFLTACTSTPNLHSTADPGDTKEPDEAEAAPSRMPDLTQSQGARELLAAMLADAARAQEPPDSRTDSAAWAAFYAPDIVHAVQIALPETSVDALEDDGRTWVPAAVTIDGLAFPNAGVRRKGNSTWRSLSDKPSLKIKLREFGTGPRLAGLERLTLNNMVTDTAQAREVIALHLWRELGATAPRASWAEVTINGEPYGLYSNIEALDDEWISRRYDHDDGDLWEANDDADFTEGGLEYWELSEGNGDTTRLTALSDALAEDASSFDAQVGHLVDVDHFLRYWVTCVVTGASDGYPFKLNDVFVYADPGNGGRFDFTPWSMDEAWGEVFNRWTAGELARACNADPACELRMRDMVVETLATLETLDVAGIVDEAYAVTGPYVERDTRSPYLPSDVATARGVLRARIAGWPTVIRQEFGL